MDQCMALTAVHGFMLPLLKSNGKDGQIWCKKATYLVFMTNFVIEIYEEEVKGQHKDSRGLYLQIDPIFGL